MQRNVLLAGLFILPAVLLVIFLRGLLFPPHVPPPEWVVAIHMGAHDNTMVISQKENVHLVLELERIFGVRYFAKSHEKPEFVRQWTHALAVASAHILGSKTLPSLIAQSSSTDAKPEAAPTLNFHTAIVVGTYAKHIQPWMVPTLKTIFRAKRWELDAKHEASHAIHGFYDSSFKTALIVTSDTDEHDGLFNVWWGSRSATSEAGEPTVQLLRMVPINVALAFEFVGANMDEMNSGRREPRCWKDHPLHCNKYAGTLMGYSSLGKPTDEWKTKLRPLFLSNCTEEAKRIMEAMAAFPTDQATQRTIAASAQALLEDLLIEQIAAFKKELGKAQGIVITGDMGLNVKASSAVQRHFDKPMWVPEAPSDDGVPIGAIWRLYPPSAHQELMYMGLPIIDAHLLPELAAKYGAHTVSPADAAAILKSGKVIGLMQGRQEVGPRALLHRSLIAVPTSTEARTKMNKIKARQWFRPVAPSMTYDTATRLFAEKYVESPYMSFAPKLHRWVEKKFPAVYHYDGSARPQTLRPHQNPWAYKMLDELAKYIGEAIVINTSFNTKGRPIINSVEEALEMMRTMPELDYVLAEEYLFSRDAVLQKK